MPRVLLATCAEMPAGDEDEQVAIAALRAAGVGAQPAVWDDPAVDWSGADLVIVRSTWDYTLRRAEFLAWARSVPRLANPAEVLAWNSDKTYLRQLADAGLPVAPTRWYEPGDDVQVPAGDVVVKPTVSAGAKDTQRHRDAAAARAHAAALLDTGRAVMVQPYLDAVDSAGETGLVWMADRFSHAFGKGALLAAGAGATDGLYAVEQIEARQPSRAERETAEHVLDALAALSPAGRGDLLYARVDLVPGPSGEPVLLELELTEPSLWFVADASAPARWVEAVQGWLARV
ncbi:MAG: hypothetical protein M3386_07960 [Actinomycetota bacterium]|nr:hypothetical protein [Actinomycetota bacterium]